MSATAVAKKLGGKRVLRREINSQLDLAEVVRAGLPSGALDYFMSEARAWLASQTDVYAVVGRARTLQRKRTEGVQLSVDESDRLARLARLVVRAEDALGDTVKAHHWLLAPNRALGGQRPLTLLGSDAGALAVERVLGRIEHGVFS
jgi:putative toxin-antitoxin system antitoxin component (TIGR02293 family)